MKYATSIGVLVLLLGCARVQPPPLPDSSQLHELESFCRDYHLQHHADDEAAASVAGKVEFTDYKVVGVQPQPGGATVTLHVSQKSVAPAGVFFVASSLPTGGPLVFEDRWLYRDGKWSLSERIKVGGIIFQD